MIKNQMNCAIDTEGNPIQFNFKNPMEADFFYMNVSPSQKVYYDYC